MTRQVVLDTETTGLEVEQGHRIIEIGCVELVNRRRTQRTFQHYLQPDRAIDIGAIEVHGISNEMLADKPRFGEIAEDFFEFIRGAELIIHNAEFDMAFIRAEFARLEHPAVDLDGHCRVVDTLPMARRLHPGQRNSLDALCKRYEIDNSGRDYHGALLDAQLLADVYLAMTGGQTALLLDAETDSDGMDGGGIQRIERDGFDLTIRLADAAEREAHDRFLRMMEQSSPQGALWRRGEPG